MLVSIEVLAWNFGGFGKNNAALDPRLDFNFAWSLAWGFWGMAAKAGRWQGTFRCLNLAQS
jgi:hypothetical protein